MPKRKNPYRRRRRRRYRKRRNYPMSVPKMAVPNGIPTQTIAKLRYCDSIDMVSNSGTLGFQTFRANSIFDPDYTGLGHQPYPRDTWSQLYNHYVVLGSKITVIYGTSGDTQSNNQVVGVLLGDQNTAGYTDYTEFMEAGKGSYKVLSDQRNAKYAVCKYSAKKFYQVANVSDNVDRLGAAMTTNPTEQAFFHLWCQSQNKSSTTNCPVTVQIDYIVKFSEPKLLSQS